MKQMTESYAVCHLGLNLEIYFYLQMISQDHMVPKQYTADMPKEVKCDHWNDWSCSRAAP